VESEETWTDSRIQVELEEDEGGRAGCGDKWSVD